MPGSYPLRPGAHLRLPALACLLAAACTTSPGGSGGPGGPMGNVSPVDGAAVADIRFPAHLEPPPRATEERILEAVAALWSQDLKTCTEAGRTLHEYGEVAVPYLGFFGPAQKELRPGRKYHPSALVLPRILQDLNDTSLAAAVRSHYPTVRVAAARVAGESRREALVPELIEGLDDSDQAVRRASAGALRRISLEFFGYRPLDPKVQRDQVVARWRTWARGRAASPEDGQGG